MNVLFLTLNSFSSLNEKGIYTDLLREFKENGHNLFIITPVEKRRNEPTELIIDENSYILKLRIGNIQKTNLVEKGITTLTIETKYKSAIKEYFKDVKFDLVLYSTPPITLQRAVEYVKKRDNAKTYLLLKDIFPQNAVDLEMLATTGVKGILYKHFKLKEKRLYKSSDYIGCMSDGNVKYLLEHNPSIPADTVEVCPNSIEPLNISISDQEKNQIKSKYEIPNDKTVFIYGGNLGKPQGIDFLIQCIKANERNHQSYFVVVGAGTEYRKINSFFENEQPRNSKLLSHLPKEDYEKLVNSCDVGLIFLDKRFTIPNFPSRLLSYMQASMPVLATTDVNTDIGDVITQGDFGYWCESKSVEEFNKFVNKLCNPSLRLRFGSNAREFLENNYTVKHTYEIIMNHFK